MGVGVGGFSGVWVLACAECGLVCFSVWVVGGFGSFRRSWFSTCGVRDGWLVLNCLVSGV